VNVYRMRASGAGVPDVLIDGPGVEVGARTSQDDHWLAYLSDDTGRLDVFIRSMAPSGPKLQVSTGGVQFGWWTRDGQELRFLKRDQTLWSVPIDLRASAPRLGAAQQVGTFPPGIVSMDLARDGRFLAVIAERADGGAVTVVQSWQSALPPGR
jgi:Tol biopolymer transport system component